jgi:hypothetical protein
MESRLPRALRKVPLVALLSWAGLGAVGAVVVLAASLRSAQAIEALEEDETVDASAPMVAVSASASASAPPVKAGPPQATKADVEAARLAGVDALFALAQRFPEDRAVLRALFLMQAAEKKHHASALRTVRHLAEIAPETGVDTEVTSTLVSLANLGTTETSSLALDVMVSMGDRGGDLLFEVAAGQAFFAKTRALQLLKDKDIRARAPAALLIAADLLESRPCARKLLLERAKNEGDARSVAYLRPLVNPVCGGGGGRLGGLFGGRGQAGGECFRCFTPADKVEIQAAIDAIAARDPRARAAPAPSGSAAGN